MTTEEQNRAIAEWCGWTDIRPFKDYGLFGCPDPNETDREHIPDYATNLNAMHKSIGRLDRTEREQFARILFCMVVITPTDEPAELVWFGATATCQQNAEALLRTIGEWKE